MAQTKLGYWIDEATGMDLSYGKIVTETVEEEEE